jgi:hypothetical protein
VAAPWADFEFAGHAKLLAEPGHEVYKLTPDQLAAWRNAVAPVETQWADSVRKIGYDPKTVLDGLRQSLTKYKAGF